MSSKISVEKLHYLKRSLKKPEAATLACLGVLYALMRAKEISVSRHDIEMLIYGATDGSPGGSAMFLAAMAIVNSLGA